MKLSQLLSAVGVEPLREAEISTLTCDSREVTPGALFVALEGANCDGGKYIDEALARGAAAVVCGAELPEGVNGAAVNNPRAALSALAAEFYGHPAEALTLAAVTGTKGKTTTAHMIREIFASAGFKTGMIGTLGAFIETDLLEETGNTTPEPAALQRILRRMVDAGCSHVVMEVSSQAMKLRRVDGVQFDAAVFLNLSPDHIGGAEHADFGEYRACKAALFRQCRLAVGNADDPNWTAMLAQVPRVVPVRTFGFGEDADVRGGQIFPGKMSLSTRFSVDGVPFDLPLPGRFNAANALAAITLCRALGIEDDAIRAGLSRVSVPGRCQRFPADAPYTVLIDYAHNGESFRALLEVLRGHPHRRILVLFGAGGDRPKIRRRDMARAAAEGADYAVITEDNPRSERPEDICRDIFNEIDGKIPCEIVVDRREAIFRILHLARPGDIVALVGKGHESYILQDGVRREFSEWAVLKEFFGT